MAASGAQVVAVTGSYGKTSTKAYIAHLLGGAPRVLASPASYNNRMGLARAINENLADGTKVFVAEMGTYGPGEIADLVEWLPPRVSVITAIGPVHLERFGSEERIVRAKREIVDGAEALVLNVDHPGLAAIASEEASRRRVITCSSGGAGADVTVGEAGVLVNGRPLGMPPDSALAGNVACAVGAALAMGVTEGEIAHRLSGLPVSAHRRAPLKSPDGGFAIIDDTYNANPAGAAAALAMLDGVAGQKVVVTPGMVELGSRQKDENRAFAAAAAAVADQLIIVGRTNRRSLAAGASGGKAAVLKVGRRQEAVDWVKSHLGPGDVVLYENDLPDHYP
jgi:UDP-N-acetylmuramoyl-tripeptide--D-alanyl-D-alanine ligase